jgi:hypothetical protein
MWGIKLVHPKGRSPWLFINIKYNIIFSPKQLS